MTIEPFQAAVLWWLFTVSILVATAFAIFVGFKLQQGSGKTPAGVALAICVPVAIAWYKFLVGGNVVPGMVIVIGTPLLVLAGFLLPGPSSDKWARILLWASLGWALLGGLIPVIVIIVLDWLGVLGKLVPLWAGMLSGAVLLAIIAAAWWFFHRDKKEAAPTTT